MEEKLKGKLYKEVLIVIGLLLTIEIILGIFFTEKFGFVMSKMLYLIGDYFGWWINLLAVFSVILGMVLIIFKWGDVKIGGIDAKPDFTTWQWYSISICGGIGCGLLYWAMGEPLYHFMQPPAAIHALPESRDAAILLSVRPCFIGPLSSTSFIPFRPALLHSFALTTKSPFPWGPCWNVRWVASIVT